MLTTNTIDDIIVIRPQGRFDAYQAPQLNDWFNDNLTDTPPNVLIDLKDVTFMDTMALAILVKWMKKTREDGGDLKLCGLQQAVRIIFELSRLDKAFDIHTNYNDALDAFKRS